jgi:NarL family two-component system response regulator LiaR
VYQWPNLVVPRFALVIECFNTMTNSKTSTRATSGEQSPRTKILLVDDHPLLLKALKDLLEKETDFEIIGEVGDGEEAVSLATQIIPDVVIMDISMPNLDGLGATQQIKARCPKVAVLVLTVHTDDECILEILQAGAAGYLVKSAFGEQVVQAVRAVAAGDMILSPLIGMRLLKQAARYPTRPALLEAGEKLSTRELEVLKLTARGLSNKDIALALGIKPRTIKGHLGDIFSKLRVASRTEAVIAGLRAGFLSMDDIQ